tara:strand:+ start:8953 stop:10041 length:1089 start_codon:yes stop_codon:yes gene_type:complete
MIQQTYYYQEFPNMLTEALERYKPGAYQTFKLRAVQAMENTSLAWTTDAVDTKFGHGSNEVIPQDSWNLTHPNYREGIKWHDGFTEAHAIVQSRQHDRNANKHLSLRNTSAWSVESVGGMFAGNLFDPINYIPFVGVTNWAMRFAKMSKAGKSVSTVSKIGPDGRIGAYNIHGWKVGSSGRDQTVALLKTADDVLPTAPPVKPVATAVRWASDATMAESLFQVVKQSSRQAQGDKVDYVGASVDVAIATLTGGVLSTFPIANNIRKNLSEQQHLNNLSIKMTELRDGISGRYFGKGDSAEPELNSEQVRQNLEENINNLRGDNRKNLDASMENIKGIALHTAEGVMHYSKLLYKTITCMNKK